MTIFQKMIAVPVVALFLYGSFFFYSYKKYQETNKQVESIRVQFLPLLEITNENIHLFNQIRSIFKDAALAEEPSWLNRLEDYNTQINLNFDTLIAQAELLESDLPTQIKTNFNLYFQNANTLVRSIISDNSNLIIQDNLVQNVERFHNTTENQLQLLKQQIHHHFRESLDKTNKTMKQMIIVGATLSVIIMLIVITLTMFVSLSTRRSVYQVIKRMRELAQGSTDFSRRLSRKNKDELGYLIHWFNKLSDKLEKDYQTLKTVSITDALTQLNNRNRTDQYLPQAFETAKNNNERLALILIDIDHFKSINDNYGHLVGDEVLKQFALTLKQNAREKDFIARWGGEEFIIVSPNADKDSIKTYAESLRLVVENQSFETIDKLTASFGAVLTDGNDSIETVLENADKCLYHAKEQGRNRVVMCDK